MNTTINKLDIEIVLKNGKRMVFINGGTMPYDMVWNKGKYRWEFSDAETPDELKENENELSNFIIKSEKKNSKLICL